MMNNYWIFILVGGAMLIAMNYFQSRSQKKTQTTRQNLLDAIKQGDEVVTIGGFHGIVEQVLDSHFVIRLEPGDALAKIRKDAVANVVTAEIETEAVAEEEEDYEVVYDKDDNPKKKRNKRDI
jgi:preprotein translocase subunit YajC